MLYDDAAYTYVLEYFHCSNLYANIEDNTELQCKILFSV